MSSTNKAVVCIAAGRGEIQTLPIPQARDGYILIKTKAVALNPTDWKSMGLEGNVGKVMGCDFAGVVEEVGPNVAKPFKKGDRVCGFVHGAHNTEFAAFAEYTNAVADLVITIPDNLSFEEAATLGVGLTTVGQGLYQSLELPLPGSPKKSAPILIYGGSTATGILGIQFAKLSGLTVLTTASPRNFDYLKSLGADAVFDYHEDTEALASKIKERTNNELTLAWDCSPTAESARLCALAMSDKVDGTYSNLLGIDAKPVKEANPKVEVKSTLGYTAFGYEFTYRGSIVMPAKPEDREFAAKFWELSRQLLADGKVKVARIAVDQGGKGLEGVLKGLDDLKQGKVSGTKLVYKI